MTCTKCGGKMVHIPTDSPIPRLWSFWRCSECNFVIERMKKVGSRDRSGEQ